MLWLRMLLDLFCAGALGYLLLGRVSEPRTLWLLRGYLLLVALGWLLQRYGNLPLTAKLIEALVLVCGLALAILLQGELRRLLELLGTGRLAVLMGSRPTDLQEAGTVDLLVDTAAQLSKRRCGGLIVLDLGSDLRPEDFLNPGVNIDATLSVDLLLNLFSADSPLHDGAVLIQANRVASAGVILPLSRQSSFTRHGTRHLAALCQPMKSSRSLQSHQPAYECLPQKPLVQKHPAGHSTTLSPHCECGLRSQPPCSVPHRGSCRQPLHSLPT